MDITDIELMDYLPVGIMIDSDVKSLDKYAYSFGLSGIDFETCVTLACAKEILRFSPIKVIISSMYFTGGNITDVVRLAALSEKSIQVVLLTDCHDNLPNKKTLNDTGIAGCILKDQTFGRILKKIRTIMSQNK